MKLLVMNLILILLLFSCHGHENKPLENIDQVLMADTIKYDSIELCAILRSSCVNGDSIGMSKVEDEFYENFMLFFLDSLRQVYDSNNGNESSLKTIDNICRFNNNEFVAESIQATVYDVF